MEFACITDVGLTREKNQDSYLALANDYGDQLFIVADGIGGGKAGEVASGELVKYFEHIIQQSGPFSNIEDVKSFLEYHIEVANKYILDLSHKYIDYAGMGTTITGVFITSCGTLVLNCGDSRVYGFIDDKLMHLTKDHTYINQLLDEGSITLDEAKNHPKKHYLVKAVGIFDKCMADIHKVKDLDYYLVCSDGLHAYVSDEEISSIMLSKKSIEAKVIELKDLALFKGGFDNVTIILAKR